uniref:Nucleoprotein n=1 Tax=Veterinary Pathology Zurich virus 1 TaxID=2447921 RepID=A0A3S8NEF5_9VIRU|nr:nucleoprotein [Veterinary Pathology Zurich virus 1]
MSQIKDLTYESVKEIHSKYGIEENVIDELKQMWDKVTDDIIISCDNINEHFRGGGTAQAVASELKEINKSIRDIHNPEFIEDPDQVPVVITTHSMTLKELLELKGDVETMKKKTNNNLSQRTGTKEGWEKFVRESIGDLILFTQTGYLDPKFLKKQGTGTLAGFLANYHGMTNDCKKAAKTFKLCKESIFDYNETENQEILTNQLQVDYLFILIFCAKKQNMDLEALLELSGRCKLIFNKLPFTQKVLTQLSKSAKYSILREIENNLVLHDSPFRLNRQRFQSAISALTGCVSDRMVSSSKADLFLKDLLYCKHKDGITVNASEGSTTTYELLLHSILTTPTINAKIKNRTNVRRNGLNTVRFIEDPIKLTMPLPNQEDSITQPTSKNVKIYFYDDAPDVVGPFHKPDVQSLRLTPKAEKLMTFIDIEGSSSEPNEVAISTFFIVEGRCWLREAVFFSSNAGKDYLQNAQYCNGLNLDALEVSGLCSRDIFQEASKELSQFSKVYYYGDDVKTFLKLIGFKGNATELKLPNWNEREKANYIAKKSSQICTKSSFHSIKLKAKEQDIKLKQLPHCAAEDNQRMYNYLTSK